MELLLLVIIIFFLVYFFFIIDIFINRRTDFFILFPSKDKIHHPQIEQRIITSNSYQIDVWLNKLNSKPADFFILHFNGNASRAEDDAIILEEVWGKYDTKIWCMNYPGYGSSSNSAKLNLFPVFSERVFKEIEKVANNKPIIISGNSIGTTVAFYIAAKFQNSIQGLFLKNPPPLRQLIIGQHGWWNLWLGALPIGLSIPTELDSINNSQSLNIPAVIVSSEKDKIVPINYQNKIINQYKGEKKLVLLKDAEHNFFPSCSENKDLESAIDWLTQKVKQ